MKLKLYHYWRSSSSWRVRWALIHKGIACDFIHVNLLNNEQTSSEHLLKNPSGYVPALEIIHNNQKKFLAESTAILEYLEEEYPDQPLLPHASYDKAIVRQLCQMINAGIQPIQNLKVLKKISTEQDERKKWAQLWITEGFTALEKKLEETSGHYSFGNDLTLADMFLIPQCYNANRFDIPLKNFPNIHKIHSNALKLISLQKSHPDEFQPK